MPTYSEWYEREVVGDVTGVYTDGAISYGEGADGPYPDENYNDPTAINNAIVDAIANQATGTTGGLAYEARVIKFLASSQPIDHDRRYEATYGTINRYFTASSIPLGDWEPTLPPGAIGWEYGTTPHVTNAVLHADFRAGMTDSTNGGGLPASGSADLEVRVHSGGTWAGSGWSGYDGVRDGPLVAAEPIYRTPGVSVLRDVDVTGQLVDAWPGRVVFDVGVAHGSPPTLTNASGPFPATLAMDDGILLSMTYTFAMPYRFIYPDVTTSPQMAPLRVVQRGSDGLGFTGGRRVVGARSVQSSNRRGAAIR